jgi:hypothetical protein
MHGLWERLRSDVPDLPPIRATISSTPRRQDHGPGGWATDDGIVTGLVITVDRLQMGAAVVVETTLHDAAHLLNWTRGITDTTSRGVYHTQAYLTAAQEVGLEWPAGAERDARRGYCGVVMSDAARRRHAADVAALDEIIPVALPHLEVRTGPNTSRVDRLTLQCKCTPPRRFRMSRTAAALGPVVCGICHAEFTHE